MNASDLRAWFNGLAARERAIVVGGAAVLVVLIVYAGVVEPLSERHARIEREAAQQWALAAWMNQVGDSVRRAGPTRVGGNGDSLFAAVDRSVRNTALAGSLQRVQPEGQQTVRVWLDNAPFDEVVRWVGALERDQGVVVSAMTAERTQNAGRVNARLTLERP
jgi:general secretion pathway protein M